MEQLILNIKKCFQYVVMVGWFYNLYCATSTVTPL